MSIPSSSVLVATMTALPPPANAASAWRRYEAESELCEAHASTPFSRR